jgi:hypothetical protein
VGKSTLIEGLKKYDASRIREQIAHMETIDDNISRQVWRVSLHCLEHRENMMWAQKNPPRSIVVGDRCRIDDVAYVSAFAELGWISTEQKNNIFRLDDATYELSGTPKPISYVILLPPEDWNITRIEERWKAGEPVKWCEQNYDYLRAVRHQFELIATNTSCLLIKDTDKETRIGKIKDWINQRKFEDFIVEGRTYCEGTRSSYSS